jgi:hypothetical protein
LALLDKTYFSDRVWCWHTALRGKPEAISPGKMSYEDWYKRKNLSSIADRSLIKHLTFYIPGAVKTFPTLATFLPFIVDFTGIIVNR